MFARTVGVTLALLIALVLTARTNPDSWVLHPDRLVNSVVQAVPQHQGSTSKR